MRSAASMLELVVAIVIMGIAVMTLPLLLTQTQRNNIYTIQQEVILAARTKLGDTFTYRWDENSLQGSIARVILTDGDSELNATAEDDNARRVGHVKGNSRRKFFTNPSYKAVTPTNLKSDDGDLDDLDDFNSQDSAPLIDSDEVTNLDYHHRDFNLTTTVVYVDDSTDYSQNNIDFTFGTNTAAKSTNIKMLTLSIQGPNITPFTLRTYSSNIGENELLRKDY